MDHCIEDRLEDPVEDPIEDPIEDRFEDGVADRVEDLPRALGGGLRAATAVRAEPMRHSMRS